MPVGIEPLKQKEKGAGRNGSLAGSFAASLSSSVGVYSKATRSSHSFRLREPDSPGRGSGRPPSRQTRAATPKFNEKERAVIANLDQLSPEELDDLNQRLYASRVAKLRELRMAQDEKAALQVKLQDTLTELADSRQTAQQAASSLRADRKFVSGILRKYQVLVDRFEAQKAKADLADSDEMDTLRRSLAELHKQMSQAKNLSRVLTELEKTKVEAGELTNLLKFHKVDLAIVQAGSRQALSKAKAHKDSLFQALVGLERLLVTAKNEREERLAELASSREQEKSLSARVATQEQVVLEREVAWLQEQVTGTQNTIDSYAQGSAATPDGAGSGSEAGKRGNRSSRAAFGTEEGSMGRRVSDRSDLQVKLLKYQVDELERQIAEVKQEGAIPAALLDTEEEVEGAVGPQNSSVSVAGLMRRRPLTAGADGVDRRRTAGERATRMEASLAQLKIELMKAEQAVEGVGDGDGAEVRAERLSEARRMSILAHIEAIEKEMEVNTSAEAVEEEKQVLAGELEWLEGLINEAEKGHKSDLGDIEGLQRLLERDSSKVETQAVITRLNETRVQLESALSIADTARNDLAAVLHTVDTSKPAGEEAEKLAGIEQALDSALRSVKEQAEQGSKSQQMLNQRLAASESCVVQQQREILDLRERLLVNSEESGDAGRQNQVEEMSALKEENMALEQELRDALDANNLAAGQLRLLEAKVREKETGGAQEAGAEPDDAPEDEHALRTRLRQDQPEGHDSNSGLKVEPADVAELALIWGMDMTTHVHLLWIPERSLRAALPIGWREASDRKGQIFYIEIASGFATYKHPNDTRYRDMLLEIRSQLEPSTNGKPAVPAMNPELLEMERLRLREAAAAIERQARQLRKERGALSRDMLRATLSVEQQDEHKVKEWETKKQQEMHNEIARLRDDEAVQLQHAKEKMLVEVREQMVQTEREKIRAELLAEERQALAVERLKLRQRIIKEETAAVRHRLEEEEHEGVNAMREQIRDELRRGIQAEEEARLAEEVKEDALRKGHYIKSQKERQQDARKVQVEAARKHQESLDAQRRQEIEEYAQYLGMDPVGDAHLLWIAEMALTAPLPVGWSEHQDSAGNVFFYNKATGASTYEHPLDASFKSYYAKLKGPVSS